jgi:hypothetical protein
VKTLKIVENKKYFIKHVQLYNQVIIYSYLMCSQAIDQNIFPKVLGTAQVFYCSKPTAEGNITLELFPVLRE